MEDSEGSEVASRCFLVVTTEWDSKNGGLSTFNRLFCKALASAKQNVVCYVPTATDEEILRAEEDGVRLVQAVSESGVPPMATLLIPPDEIKNLKPDFIVGHDRPSGGYAKFLQQRVYLQSRRIHFIHTAPEEVESAKPSRNGTAAKRGEERVQEQKNQARDCALIVGVGPRLSREFGNHVHGEGYAPVHQLNPGFTLGEENQAEAPPLNLPPAIQCLILGRVEDYELKGLDVAAQSMGNVANAWQEMALPKLVVRGAPSGTGDELSARMRGEIQSRRPLLITIREYSENLDAIQSDLRGASLLLMPSCVEGFGLVALEAICMGVPVLVSEQSGIAEILPVAARSNILPTRPDSLTPLDPEFTKQWTAAIQRILEDRPKAFAAAKTLKLELSEKYKWSESIDSFLKALEQQTP
jgi:glycosyltransferase involved in cell wall biosynthesis